MEADSKKHRFRKGRSATFSIDGFNITIEDNPLSANAPFLEVIVANEEGESSNRPQASFARSKSQSALWNAITAGMGIKGKEQKPPLSDPRSPEEILADDLPAADQPDATEKTAIRAQRDIGSHVQLIILRRDLFLCPPNNKKVTRNKKAITQTDIQSPEASQTHSSSHSRWNSDSLL
ncbi:Calcium/calmodulin-dependent 3'5'-cyclic nucleotide phosphodiesterase 1C, partial [Dissostichus eleginoides]